MWGWLLGRIDFQCWVLGKEKVEHREERRTAEHGFGSGGRIRQGLVLRLLGFRKGFLCAYVFFFL